VDLGAGASYGAVAVFEQCGFPFNAMHYPKPESASGWMEVLEQLLPEGTEYVLVVGCNCKELDQAGVWEAVKLLELHRDIAIVGGRLVNQADTVVACGSVPDKFGRLISPIAGIARTDPGPFAMGLKPHCILAPADGVSMVRARFLTRALERRPGDLDRSEFALWLGACAIADDVRVAYTPLLEARTRGELVPMRDDAGPTLSRFLDYLGVAFDPRSKVIGTAGLFEAGKFTPLPDAVNATPAASSSGKRLEPVSP
jgi:hypothetical protein